MGGFNEMILYGTLINHLDEDGVTRPALQLSDELVLTKTAQHPASMVQVGEVPGKGPVWHWLDTAARTAALESHPDYLGPDFDSLPSQAQERCMEVEVPDGEGGVIRKKVFKARDDGVDVDSMKPWIIPHKFAGR